MNLFAGYSSGDPSQLTFSPTSEPTIIDWCQKQGSGPFFWKQSRRSISLCKISFWRCSNASFRNKEARANNEAPASPSQLALPPSSIVEIGTDQFNILVRQGYILITAIHKYNRVISPVGGIAYSSHRGSAITATFCGITSSMESRIEKTYMVKQTQKPEQTEDGGH